MRPVERPPALRMERLGHALSFIQRPELTAYVTKANSAYHHWDTLRRRPLPLGLSPEEGWAIVKASRSNRRSTPLRDEKSIPFTYWLPDQAHQILHLVDRQGGGALAADQGAGATFAAMRDRVLIDSLMEEAIATSQIEGAVTTRRVAKDLLRTGRKPKDRSEQMVVNGYRTVRLLREQASQPLTIDLLNEIQENMTRDTLESPQDAGRFRTDADDVHIVDSRDSEVVFTPPPANRIEYRVQELIDFANADPATEPFIHPLVRAAIIHFWLAYEHPYVDGNGRTARALFYWSMLKSGYWLFEFLTISRMIHAAPLQYYRSFLYTETDDNDLTYSIMHLLDVTRRALSELHSRIGEMAREQERMNAIRLAARLNIRQRALLDHALRHPGQIYTFESHQHSQGITYQTARTDLMGLADRGLLIETGSRKPREFLPAPDLQRRLTGKRK